MSFVRIAHQHIAEALASMDAERLMRDRCYFGGGTAIVLQNGEYRQSLDVDFLCADIDGYRNLRASAAMDGAGAFFGPEARTRRDFRIDQYGLRTIIDWHGQPIKFEIIREARIALDGAIDPALGVPVLLADDQVAEKLLANADRCFDRSVAYRDALDLGVLAAVHGGVFPAQAVAKAERAYGADVRSKAMAAAERLSDVAEIRHAATTLDMQPARALSAAKAFAGAVAATWTA